MNPPTPHSDIMHGGEIENYAEGINFTAGATKKPTGTKTPSKRRKTESTSAQVYTHGARPDGAHVKGRRGSLKLITEIPLDTLHEIFSNLEPVDLLHLSWASESLHAIVMGKSARYIWQEAFERLYASENPPPPCPEDVNLAQYSHFLFTRKCMECQIGRGKCWVSWELQLRVCWNCLQSERFTNLDSCGYSYLKSYVPVLEAKEKRFCLTRDYRSQKGNVRVVDFRRRYAQLDARRKDIFLFHSWEQNQKDERGGELGQLREERQAAILNKLTEAGWTEEEVLELTRRKIDKLPGFSKAKKLTVKDWDVLQPELTERLQEIRTEQIEAQLVKRIHSNWAQFRGHQYWNKRGGSRDFLPRLADLVFYEPFRSAIFTPSEEGVEFSLADITRAEKEWTEARNKIVLSMLPEDCSSQVATTDGPELPLLATFMFRGIEDRRGNPTYYTMDTMCRARDSFFSDTTPDGSASPEELVILEMIHRNRRSWSDGEDKKRPWMWDYKNFKFCPEAHELAKGMLVFLGLDPYTTTISQMRRRKERFRCTNCWGIQMTWNAAIAHELNRHDDERKPGIPAKKRWEIQGHGPYDGRRIAL